MRGCGILIVTVKGQRNRIDTVTLVRGCRESLSVKYVPQVATAVRASDFRTPHAMGKVVVSRNGSRDGIEKCWPSTPTVKLGRARVQRCLTSCTMVHTRLKMLIVFPCTSPFCPLLTEHTELFRTKNSTPLTFCLGYLRHVTLESW